MKNVVRCQNCGTENPFYKLTCSNCKTHLRERVSNIDLWKITGLLIESPVKAFRLIIQSEHKNFALLITVLFSIKAFIDSRFISLFYSRFSDLKISLEVELLISFGASIIIIYFYSLIISVINKVAGLKSRVRDNHAVLSYSLIPYLIALIILFPIELITFGAYLFSNNPSPFIIKPTVAYTLLCFEGLLILWGLFLSVSGMYAISKSLSYSVLIGLLFNLYLYGFFFVLSKILFT